MLSNLKEVWMEEENEGCTGLDDPFNDSIIFSFPGRYLFLNAIANQLRYPNSHTHYFSCVLLYLFAEANTEAIQEQITRYVCSRSFNWIVLRWLYTFKVIP